MDPIETTPVPGASRAPVLGDRATAEEGMVARSSGRIAGYPAAMRTMHWATAGLLLGAYLAAWSIEGATASAQVGRLLIVHRSFGLAILVLTGLRMALRQFAAIPPLPADIPSPQRLAARASVVALYTLLSMQPLLGLTASLLDGGPVVILGGIVLPALLPTNRGLADRIFEAHGLTALVLLALIAIHFLAALHHQFVRGDDVLASMVPGLRRLSRPVGLGAASISRGQ